jgi:hypothetical protein
MAKKAYGFFSLGVLPKGRLRFLMPFFAVERTLCFFIMACVWQNSTSQAHFKKFVSDIMRL